MQFPCDTCRYRQKSLDPEGCFIEVSTTGWFGRLCRYIFGCEHYDSDSYIRNRLVK